MVNINDYICNGRVEREKIAIDIKYRDLSKSDIDILVSNKKICDAFLGKSFSEKKPKSEWNKEYLDELTCAAIAECFNADYLYYLDEVADYVVPNKNYAKKNSGETTSGTILGIAFIGVALIAGLFMAIIKFFNRS